VFTQEGKGTAVKVLCWDRKKSQKQRGLESRFPEENEEAWLTEGIKKKTSARKERKNWEGERREGKAT